MDTPRIYEIFSRFSKRMPEPTTELIYHSTFELLIAVILSAQATDKSVNKATALLFKKANTPAEIFALGQAGLESYIRSIGLYKTKAKNIIATAKLLLTLHKGEVPRTREALEALPGVGRKTANVILNTAFAVPVVAVDTHIYRLARRLGLSKATTVLGVEQALIACIPSDFLQHAHHWLILHGRYICKARKPACTDCFLADLCPSVFLAPEPPKG